MAECEGDHLWYSAVAAPPRYQKYDWCVNCGTSHPDYEPLEIQNDDKQG